MRLLVLGGTRFVGRHLAAAALARGHALTLAHRGLTHPDLFPGVEHLFGDRGGDLSFLSGRRWDAVLDVNGYLPRLVRAAAQLLAGAVDRYVFVSTISAYARRSAGEAGGTGRRDEEQPLARPPAGQEETEEITDETYGWLKAACEAAVSAALPGRALIVRPGLIAGPQDPTGRFSYWPWRLARGGEVLAPAAPACPVQLIDARDLGEWIVRQVETGATGVYNACGPGRPLTLGEVLATCRDVAGPEATFTWVDESFLLDQGVTPWTTLPLWLPGTATSFAGIDNRRARAAGLTFRPLAETVRDTLSWLAELNGELPVSADRADPLTPAREAALLRAWHAREAC